MLSHALRQWCLPGTATAIAAILQVSESAEDNVECPMQSCMTGGVLGEMGITNDNA